MHSANSLHTFDTRPCWSLEHAAAAAAAALLLLPQLSLPPLPLLSLLLPPLLLPLLPLPPTAVRPSVRRCRSPAWWRAGCRRGSPVGRPGPAPNLGQHTDEVLAELGYETTATLPLPLPLHCLSSTFHCMPTAFPRPFTACPLPFLGLSLHAHCLPLTFLHVHCLSLTFPLH